jgi:hypothetical protein
MRAAYSNINPGRTGSGAGADEADVVRAVCGTTGAGCQVETAGGWRSRQYRSRRISHVRSVRIRSTPRAVAAPIRS